MEAISSRLSVVKKTSVLGETSLYSKIIFSMFFFFSDLMKCSNFRNKLTLFQYSYTDFYTIPKNVESTNCCLLYGCLSLKE